GMGGRVRALGCSHGVVFLRRRARRGAVVRSTSRPRPSRLNVSRWRRLVSRGERAGNGISRSWDAESSFEAPKGEVFKEGILRRTPGEAHPSNQHARCRQPSYQLAEARNEIAEAGSEVAEAGCIARRNARSRRSPAHVVAQTCNTSFPDHQEYVRTRPWVKVSNSADVRLAGGRYCGSHLGLRGGFDGEPPRLRRTE